MRMCGSYDIRTQNKEGQKNSENIDRKSKIQNILEKVQRTRRDEENEKE